MWGVIRIFANFCDMPMEISQSLLRIITIVNDSLWKDGIQLKWDNKTKVKILKFFISNLIFKKYNLKYKKTVKKGKTWIKKAKS